MNTFHSYRNSGFILLFLGSFFLLNCSENNKNEISTRPSVISCQYIGLNDTHDQPFVDLVFKNKTGHDIQTVFGGLRIISRDGTVLQRTGFTYSRPWKAGEIKSIKGFAYLDINNAALQALTFADDYTPMIFEPSEIVFADGRSVTY